MNNPESKTSVRSRAPDRRAFERPQMVLRVGLLEQQGQSSFCLLRNISPYGVQVKLYSTVSEGASVGLRVGDECIINGRIAWARNELAGIAFDDELDSTLLLRVRQILAPNRRRTSPRARTSAFAILRTGGREYPAKLSDISTSGAKIMTVRSIDPGRNAVLLLPKLPPLRAFVRWTQEQDTGLIFETPIPMHIISQWLADQPQVTVS